MAEGSSAKFNLQSMSSAKVRVFLFLFLFFFLAHLCKLISFSFSSSSSLLFFSSKSGLDIETNVKSSAPLRLRLEWTNVSLQKNIKEGSFFRSKTSQKQILKDLSGAAEPGELLAIMGPSGGGKTSLLNTLSRRAKITSGSITLNGKKIPK